MGNPITDEVKTGTMGELFVQLRLLEFGVQAAPPIKDSGNDLIAIKGEVVKFIQVKTSKNNSWNLSGLPNVYHLIALVQLESCNNQILFDRSDIFFLNKGDKIKNKEKISNELVNKVWSR